MAKHLVINKRAEIEDTGVSLESLLNRVAALEGMITWSASGGNSWCRIGNIQICWNRMQVNKGGNSSTWGNSWWGSGTWTYAKSFSAVPAVAITADDSQSGLYGASTNGYPTTKSCPVQVYGSANFTSCWINVVAVGPWR